MGLKRPCSPEPAADLPSKAGRLDSPLAAEPPDLGLQQPSRPAIDPPQTQTQQHHAASTEAHSSLDSHDLLTILVCNDAFVEIIDLPTLNKLPRLSRQYTRILSLVADDLWNDKLYIHLGIESIFDADGEAYDVDGIDIDERAILEGACHFLSRKNHLPRSHEAYQKELSLWWALAMLPILKCGELGERLDQATGNMPTRLCDCITYDDSKKLETPDLNEQFRLLDASQIIRKDLCEDCEASVNHESVNYLYIGRFGSNPFYTDSQLAALLPHEYAPLSSALVTNLTLIDCSFASLSGWPNRLDGLSSLCIKRTSQGPPIESLAGMPSIPKLRSLSLPDTFASCEDLPRNTNELANLDISSCTRITSLNGLPSFPNLSSLTLPPFIESLESLPQALDQLYWLDLSACIHLKSLKGLPPLPRVSQLRLPPSIESLEGLPPDLDRLHSLDFSACIHLRSLEGLPPLPRVSQLELPPSIESLEGLPQVLDQLHHLNLSACIHLKSLRGLPPLRNLLRFQFPPSIESLEGLPPDLGRLYSLDLSTCIHLKSLRGLPPLPSVSQLTLPKFGRNLNDLSGWVDWLKESPTWNRLIGSSQRLERAIPKLLDLDIALPIGGFDALRGSFGALNSLRINVDGSENVISSLPLMPKLTRLSIAGTIKDMSQWCEPTRPSTDDSTKQCDGIESPMASKMPNLNFLVLPASIELLDQIPTDLHLARELDLSACERLRSVGGLSPMKNLCRLKLPASLKTLKSMKRELASSPSLTIIAPGLETVEGMPAAGLLRDLQLNAPIVTLEGMYPNYPSLRRLSLTSCSNLKSLTGMPQMPMLEVLSLPYSIETLRGMPTVQESIKTLSLNRCDKLKSLEGLPSMPRLVELTLPSNLESLDIPSVSLNRLERLQMASCCNLTTLEGFPQVPQLKFLSLPSSVTSFKGLPLTLGSLRTLILANMESLASLDGLPHMPKLNRIVTPEKLRSAPIVETLRAAIREYRPKAVIV
ncbi:uncharacterized protein BJ171DRAFT_567072 [Polychytrium aggregatum]|uniref:uncharacterized protein n=1 Tax=Polychytrium aggregatum TaxID=110093 RepID=UPI0022FE3181|nr:uncharacterized protein BJ171DRAFT_567072 [Polychytrium aggregatum]KAI9205733.1 hypothetical protein BJ171DRAFT_567072 [Polychytrium aggregatum]